MHTRKHLLVIAVTALLAGCHDDSQLQEQLNAAEAERDALRAEVDELRREYADAEEPEYGPLRMYALEEVNGELVRREIPVQRVPIR